MVDGAVVDAANARTIERKEARIPVAHARKIRQPFLPATLLFLDAAPPKSF